MVAVTLCVLCYSEYLPSLGGIQSQLESDVKKAKVDCLRMSNSLEEYMGNFEKRKIQDYKVCVPPAFARFTCSTKNCFLNTHNSLKFTTDTVVEVSFIAARCRASIFL